MNFPRLIPTLASFNSKDWELFQKYSQFKLIDTSPTYLLTSWIIENKKLVLECEQYEDVRPYYNKAQSLASFTNLMTKITTHVDDFIAYSEFQREKSTRKLYLLKATAYRGLEKSYDYHYKKTIGKKSKSNKVSIWDDLERMQAAHFDYYYNLRSDPNEQRITFQAIIENFKQFIGKAAQIYSLEMLNRSSLLKETLWAEDIKFLDPIYDQETDISRYMDSLILLIDDKDENGFKVIFDAVCKEDTLSSNFKYILSTYLMSFIHYDIKENGADRGLQSFELYKTAIEEEYLTNGNSMSYRLFLNVLNASCNASEFKWSYKFIEDWAPRVDRKFTKETAKLGEAHINFFSNNHEDVIRSMNSFEHPSHALKIIARWLHLCSSFELYKNDYDLMKSFISSFQTYLKSKKISITKSTFQGMTNGIKILEMLIGVNKKQRLIKFMENDPTLFSGKWLRSKIKEKFKLSQENWLSVVK